MPFNFLLANQFHHGTSFNENGVSISVIPKSGETFLFFHLDSDNNKRLREDLGIGGTGRICDLLIYYFNVHDDKPSICLVELKGINVSHGITQVENIYDAIRRNLKAKHIFKNFNWGALVVHNPKSQSPRDNKVVKKRFKDKECMFDIIKKDEADFIRNIS